MAQFLGVHVKGSRMVYLRCSIIERVEAAEALDITEKAPPNSPILLVLKGVEEALPVYACSVMDILHGITRDDCVLDRFIEEDHKL